MRRFRIIALAAVISAAAFSPGAAQQQPDIQADVKTFVHQYIDAINRADVRGLMDMYARVPDVTSADNTDVMHGWDAIRNDVASLQQSHYRMDLDSISVVALGTDYALAVAKASYTFGTPQGTLRVRGVLTLVVQKVGNAWKVIHDHSSTQEPGGD